MESDYKVAGVPAAHCKCEQRQHPLKRGESVAVRNKLDRHPKRQERANAIADEL